MITFLLSFVSDGRLGAQTGGLAVPQNGGTGVRYSIEGGNLTAFPECPTLVGALLEDAS